MMKRFAAIVLCAGLLASCGTGNVRERDTLDQPMTLTPGKAVSGVIAGQARDFDYYAFTAQQGEQFKLVVQTKSASSGSTLDPYVWILMPDKLTELEKGSGADGGQDTEFRFNAPVTGTYYVKVTSFTIRNDAQASDNKASNTYTLRLTRR